MAAPKKLTPSAIKALHERVLNKRGYASELTSLQKADAAQRAAAEKILDPSEVSGDYDAKRLLFTTLGGGKPRHITHDDLRTFSANAKRLGKKFVGGITAQGVIDLSDPVDLARSREQIKMAVVTRMSAGKLFFVTNAGPNSDKQRHHVTVEFPTFAALAAKPSKPDRLAKPMLDGQIKFDCDCGRHQFWFRYIATIGGFNAGRAEPGFPKIRNPKLFGVGCKHVLRVMQAVLTDMSVRAYATQMIAAGQKLEPTTVAVSNQEAREHAKRQAETAHHLRNTVRTSAEMGKKPKEQAALKKAVAIAAEKARKKPGNVQAIIRDAIKSGALSKDELRKILNEAP